MESNQNDLMRCPLCGEEVLSIAKKCKHCGEWLDESQRKNAEFDMSDLIKHRQNIGLIGSVVLGIAVFLPLLSVPLLGQVNYFQNGKGDGVIILVLAIFSFYSAFGKKYKLLRFTGIGAFAVVAFTFINLKWKMHFEMPDMATNLIQFEWGWAVLILGATLITVSAVLKGKGEIEKKEPLATTESTVKSIVEFRSLINNPRQLPVWFNGLSQQKKIVWVIGASVVIHLVLHFIIT